MRLAPSAITFDAQGTLIDVRYDPPQLLADLAADLGILVEADTLPARYAQLFGQRHPAYMRAVKERGAAGRRAFWAAFIGDILGVSIPMGERLSAAAEERLFDPAAGYWSLYPDTLPTLQALRANRVRLAVISNWDDTLHTVLDMLGISDYFEFALASLEQGVEKPHARIFGTAVRRLGYDPYQIAHVGDSVEDDVAGAKGVGMFPILVDRSALMEDAGCATIHTLTEVSRLYE